MTDLTIAAALKAQVNYPLGSDFFSSVLIKRGLDGDSPCTKELMESVAFRGAKADCLKQIIMFPNSVSEGGLSISKADRDSLTDIANSLLTSIGEKTIGEKPRITCY